MINKHQILINYNITCTIQLKSHSSSLQLSEDLGYVLYSALGSFYIPSCIMVFVYIRIYFAAKARARRGIRKPPRPRPAAPPPESPDIRQTSFTHTTSTGTPATGNSQGKTPGLAMENVATIESQPVQIPIVTCDFASDVSTSEADGGGGNIPMEEKDTLKVRSIFHVLLRFFFLVCDRWLFCDELLFYLHRLYYTVDM